MAEASLDVIVGANIGPLQKGLKKAEATAANFVKGIGSVAKLVATTAAGTAVAMVTTSIVAYRKVEEAQSKLTASLKANGQAAGVSVSQVAAFATQLSTTTRFAAAATTEAAAGLARFQNIKGGNFTETIKQSQNLATVMGKDLPAASQLVGHALNNPIEGYLELARAGVGFSDSQIDAIQSMQQAGDIAGAQGVILAQLQSQFGGAAEAAGDTLAGKLDILMNSVMNVAAVVGEAMVPSISVAVQWITDLVKSIDMVKVKSVAFEWMTKAVGFAADAVQMLKIGFMAAKTGILQGLTFMVQGFLKLSSGIEWAINGMRKLAGLDAVKSQLGSVEEFAKAMQNVTDESAGEVIKAWEKPWASAETGKFFEEMKVKGVEAAEVQAKAIHKGPVAAVKLLTERQIEAQTEATNMIRQMQMDVKYFGMDDKQRKVAELKEKGASAGQVSQMSKLGHQLRGKELTQEFASPLENFQREMIKLKEVFDSGSIDQRTFDKARGKLVGDFQSAMPQSKVAAGGAMTARSGEARSAILNYRNMQRSADPMVALQRLEEQVLEETKQQTWYLRQLAKGQPQVASFSGI